MLTLNQFKANFAGNSAETSKTFIMQLEHQFIKNLSILAFLSKHAISLKELNQNDTSIGHL